MLEFPIFWVLERHQFRIQGFRFQFPTAVASPSPGSLGRRGSGFSAGRNERVSYYFSLINRLSAACRWVSLPPYVIPTAAPSDSDTCHWRNVNMKCIYVEMWKNICAKYKHPPSSGGGCKVAVGKKWYDMARLSWETRSDWIRVEKEIFNIKEYFQRK